MARWSRMGLRAARGVASAGTALFLLLAGPPRADAGEVVEYYHLDAIGNVRAVTNEAGQVVERHDYLPFGEECTTGACASNPGLDAGQPRKFTGKERDTETGLDYFGARYYGSKIGTIHDDRSVPGDEGVAGQPAAMEPLCLRAQQPAPVRRPRWPRQRRPSYWLWSGRRPRGCRGGHGVWGGYRQSRHSESGRRCDDGLRGLAECAGAWVCRPRTPASRRCVRSPLH